MRRDWILAGLTTGVLAASSTAGALLAFGLRLGTPARPFNAIGALLLGGDAMQVFGFAAGPTLVGVLLHLVAVVACGVLYAALVGRKGHSVAWAIVLAILALAASWAIGHSLGVGLAPLLPLGNLIVLGVVLALSLPIGMRFAFPPLYRD
ncbi:MAG TPA: hypothetical protein VJU87_11955 [Gemmatimonadaceae bacterium]|nr:hypothetical protein [Gemmatimonadaceae bacterium]